MEAGLKCLRQNTFPAAQTKDLSQSLKYLPNQLRGVLRIGIATQGESYEN